MLLPYLYEDLIEAGCDEAGRGCLAGAVYAAAVILPKDFKNELLNDSKQLSEKQRYALRDVIEREALAWAVGVVSPEEIDRINILNASFSPCTVLSTGWSCVRSICLSTVTVSGNTGISRIPPW